MEFTVTESWLNSNNVDIMDFLAALSNPEPTGWYEDGTAYWIVTGEDTDGNNIPDFLDSLIGNTVVTNPSQGGWGG